MDKDRAWYRTQDRLEFDRASATNAGSIHGVIFGKAACQRDSIIGDNVDYVSAFELAFYSNRACRKQAAACLQRPHSAFIYTYPAFNREPPAQPSLSCRTTYARSKICSASTVREPRKRVIL